MPLLKKRCFGFACQNKTFLFWSHSISFWPTLTKALLLEVSGYLWVPLVYHHLEEKYLWKTKNRD